MEAGVARGARALARALVRTTFALGVARGAVAVRRGLVLFWAVARRTGRLAWLLAGVARADAAGRDALAALRLAEDADLPASAPRACTSGWLTPSPNTTHATSSARNHEYTMPTPGALWNWTPECIK